jgi:hypothetical protein
LPHLQLKTSGIPVGGLQLKLGDNAQGYGTTGVSSSGSDVGAGSATLTESKLKLKTGDDATGANQAGNEHVRGFAEGGVPGIQNIYQGGPSPFWPSDQPAAQPPSAQSGLQLKMGDSAAATSAPASASDTGTVDFNKMTPQQLADAAESFSKLPPEVQQRAMAAAQAAPAPAQQAPPMPAKGWTATQANDVPAPQPAPAVTPQTAAQPIASLQQQANASQAAAAAPSLEDASAKARAGFDTPLGPVKTNPAAATTSGQPSSASTQTPATAAAGYPRGSTPASTPMPSSQAYVSLPSTPMPSTQAYVGRPAASNTADSSVIADLSPSSKPAILATPSAGGKPYVMSVSECVASYSPNGSVPSLEELQKKLESTMTAMERIAKSQEEANDLNEDWSEELRDAHRDIFNNGSDTLLDGLLGVSKTSLEMYKESYQEGLEASMKESQQLRAEYLAVAGDPAMKAAWQAKKADYLARAQNLLGRRELIENGLAGAEKAESLLDQMQTGRDFYLWLTDNEVLPCKFGDDGKINCDDLKKNNGVSKFAQGDLNTQLDLLKQVMKFGVHYSPYIKALSHGSLIVDTWDISSLAIDLTYDETAIYESKQRLQQVQQNDAQFAKAREVLGDRIDRLNAEIDCYQRAH